MPDWPKIRVNTHHIEIHVTQVSPVEWSACVLLPDEPKELARAYDNTPHGAVATVMHVLQRTHEFYFAIEEHL